MITILTWVAVIAGSFLILMMLLSVIGGLDLDVDIGSTDVETDAGGIGLIKGVLTFISVASWVMKVLLVTSSHPALAIGVGIISGMVAFGLLNWLFKVLLNNEEDVNWEMEDSILTKGEVYLKIPSNGSGIVNINVKGAKRELKAKALDNVELPTGTQIQVVDIEKDYVIVKEYK